MIPVYAGCNDSMEGLLVEKDIKMDEYEYELLNMSFEDMDRIANGEDVQSAS